MHLTKNGECVNTPSDTMPATYEKPRRGITEDKFKELHSQYAVRILNFIRRYSPRIDAEDVASEAWMLAWRGRESFEWNSTFFTWLCRIATNEVKTRVRDAGTPTRLVDLTPITVNIIDEIPSSDRAVDVVYETKTMSAIARSSMKPFDLPLVHMKFELGMKFNEIALATGLPEGTVKTRIHRARQTAHAKLMHLARRPASV